jgi:release factor glutamine methyltransferase
MTLQRLDDIRFHYREEALERGINPRDVDLLLGDLLDRPMSWLIAHDETEIDPAPLEALLARRYSGEPLQYIRNRTEFYSREFYVDDRVLIPRPETELLVEAALEHAPQGGRVIDIGTGSGCIAITIERERPDLQVVSVDRSVEALAVAAINRARLQSRVALAASDLMSAVIGTYDVIVSNPPYVPLREYEELAVEVRIHEPRIALTPGPSGLEIIEQIFHQARTLLAPRGHLILEVGYGQEAALRALADAKGFNVDAFLPDLAGIPRVVVSSMHHVE